MWVNFGDIVENAYLCSMKNEDIFTLALGLTSPWEVTEVQFLTEEDGNRTLHIHIGFQRGASFLNDAGKAVKAYDTEEKQWRHLNFFQHECYIHCRVPRIPMADGKMRMVSVPWARPKSGFTLLFEAYAMLLIEGEMPVATVAETTKETAPRIWRVFRHWIEKARTDLSFASVTRIGVDETSSRKGHRYITNFVDLDTHALLFSVEGKGFETFTAFVKELEARGGKRENIQVVSMDMSPSFFAGYMEYFPTAALVFDKFHIIKALNKALDDIRKNEANSKQSIKRYRFMLLKSSKNLNQAERERLQTVFVSYPGLGQAYAFREGFNDLFSCSTPKESIDYLKDWCAEVGKTTLAPLKQFVNLIKAHWRGVTTLFTHPGVNNGILEGINQKIQLAKRRARGYTDIDNFINMAYLMCGKLNLIYPHKTL